MSRPKPHAKSSLSSAYPLQNLSQRNSFSGPSMSPRTSDEPPLSASGSRTNGNGNGGVGLSAGYGKGKKKRVSDVDEEEALLGRYGDGTDPDDRNEFASLETKQSTSSTNKGKAKSRTIPLQPISSRSPYPANVVRNQKYTVITFLPLVFYEQFKFFFNFYFLVVALSQFIPALKIGYIVTYVAPLAFVLAVTMGKEAYDDYCRYLRDREANSTRYLVLLPQPASPMLGDSSSLSGAASLPRPQTRSTPASSIKVGDMVLLEKNQRVPADMVLLTTSEEEGTCFIRTDQLDGETDWKLKVAVGETQKMGEKGIGSAEGSLYADPPIKDIHTFYGVLNLRSLTPGPQDENSTPLTVENVLWANTVLAAGSAVGLVVYTGKETRAVLNTSEPETKMGTLEKEVNKMAKILCTVTFALSVFLVALNGFRGQWYIYVVRFLILFSSIIPISLRVNLDMGKTVYAHQIQSDPEIPETVVRTSTLPEELGRIEYLLSDKTGTLTRNEMELKKLHMGTLVFGWDSMDEVAHLLSTALQEQDGAMERRKSSMSAVPGRGRRDMSSRVRDAVMALATCHNVTPVTNDDGTITYQASSPDEVAIVQWTESVGLRLTHRDRTSMVVCSNAGQEYTFDILAVFPFTSESKRMGIVVRDRSADTITFVQKGADTIMSKLVQKNDWLDEECGNMAREGLRTLVLGRKRLSDAAYSDFDSRYRAAQLVAGEERASEMSRVVSECLENELELLALTGVEDKLQEDVKSTLELMRNAGVKIWMLTGDKIETATNIAVSSKLVARGQYIHQVAKLKSSDQVRDMLDFLHAKLDCCLVIDGESLQLCLDRFRTEFVMLATQLPAVVACRCSPTQKADVARLIREFTKKTVCCIGDGGNDVSMIQAADVGVGIVGKEGKQASLAADFSINQFSYLTKLLLWHGRNSYKRSAKLSQFVIHRGLIIAVIQAVFSSIFFFAPIALYQGWLQVGYATLYTMAPVFSLVLDRDVNEDLALLYPELYKDLTKGRSLSYKTFFTWLTISVYQGGIIMLLSLLLFESEFLHIVAISFTALVINELIMVALEVTTWHTYMVLSELGTAAVYLGSMAVLPAYFDLSFVLSQTFAYKVAIIVAVSSFPLYVIKAAHQRFNPAAYTKVAGI
ncbi:hypothetical protein IAU59_001059 [Kwoniella sp. CBS 9459]